MNVVRTGILMAVLAGMFLVVGFLIGGVPGMAIAFLFAAGTNLWAYWNSDKALLSMYGARPVDPQSAPQLINLVRQLSGQAGLPMPKVYIVENEQPNAFATGRDPEHAAVCVTSGLLSRVNNEELAGVLAHELGHVKHRDTLTMTITATLAGAISMLGNFAFFFGGRRDSNNPLGGIGLLVAMIVAPLAAMLVQMAISRTREYSADRRGAEICGNPLWLASALGKIARSAQHVPNDAAERNPATAHMFIINPLSGQRMDNLFSTHPNTENRIAALQDLAGRMGGGGAGFAPGSTGPVRAANAVRRSRTVPDTGSNRGGPQPPKGPWS